MKNNSLPPLGWLRAFESAARLLSFTAAADELGLTQSAISQQISALEARFGSQLFVRKHRGIALTDDARRLLPGVTDGIAKLHNATLAFDTTFDSTVLTIATSVSVAQWYLVPNLQEFKQQNPEVRIRIITAVWPDELATSTADVRIRFCPSNAAGKRGEPLGSNRMCLVAATTCIENKLQPRQSKNKKNTKALSEELINTLPLIQAVGTSDTWEQYAELTNIPTTKTVSTFVDSHGLAVDFAKSGAGMAMTSALISAPLVANGELSLLKTEFMPAKDGYFIDNASGSDNPVANDFIDWLKDKANESEQLAYGDVV